MLLTFSAVVCGFVGFFFFPLTMHLKQNGIKLKTFRRLEKIVTVIAVAHLDPQFPCL